MSTCYNQALHKRRLNKFVRMVANGFVITVNDLKLALVNKYIIFLELLLNILDSSFEDQIALEISDILTLLLRAYSQVRIGANLLELTMSFDNVRVIDVQYAFKYILNRFDVDVGFVNSSKDSVIQGSLDFREERLTETEDMQLFVLVANRDEFNVDQNVQYEQNI